MTFFCCLARSTIRRMSQRLQDIYLAIVILTKTEGRKPQRLRAGAGLPLHAGPIPEPLEVAFTDNVEVFRTVPNCRNWRPRCCADPFVNLRVAISKRKAASAVVIPPRGVAPGFCIGGV